MSELSTQERILIELKKQNALLEEQVKPQRREQLYYEKRKFCGQYATYLVNKINPDRKEIFHIGIKLVQKKWNLEGWDNAVCPVNTNNYMGSAGISEGELRQIQEWRETRVKEKEDLKQEIINIEKELDKLLNTMRVKYMEKKPDEKWYKHYILGFAEYFKKRANIEFIRDTSRCHFELSYITLYSKIYDSLKNEY